VVIWIPVAETRGGAVAPWLRLALRPACHQISDRCLDLGSGPLPVCARCAGLYVGGFVGLFFTAVGGRRLSPSWWILLFAAAPSVFDFAIGQLGFPALANWPRFWFAAVPGLILGLLLADAISVAAANPAEPRGASIT
jgi:uncharacterized membrane protein